jgi:hypothetical protein
VKMQHSAEGGQFWGAHASRVLVSASRRNNLFLKDRPVTATCQRESPRSRDAFASTRDACAPQNGDANSDRLGLR